MAKYSIIEWTEVTWNPVTGCTKISSGCKNCYAERFAKRLQKMGNKRYRNGFAVMLQPDMLHVPLSWRAPRIVFVNSMSDLFHEKIPLSYIQDVFGIMNACPQHIFQILTKRSKRLAEVTHELHWSPNIWMGVSVEEAAYLYRIDDLRQCQATTKFISFEPLLGFIPGPNIDGMDWVIVGGESGPRARPMKKEWIIDIRDACTQQNIPFFFKQWGGVNKKKTGRMLEGKTWNQMPQCLFNSRNQSKIKSFQPSLSF